MRFTIETLVQDEQVPIQIDEKTFEDTATAVQNLSIALGIEEKLDLLLENFAEYEREILRLASDYKLHLHHEWSGFRYDLQAINRRLVNFLTAARLYLDQVQHDVSSLHGGESLEHLKAKIRSEYDSSLAYRILELVRNHVQHRSLPIGKTSYSIDRESNSEQHNRLRCSFLAYLDVDQLLANPKGKRQVVEEFAQLSPQPDVTLLLGEYVEALCRVHEYVRQIIDPDILRWEAAIAAVRETAGAKWKSLIGLAVVARDEHRRAQRQYHIVEEVSTHRTQLRAKNHYFKGLGSRYVASEGALDTKS